MFSRPSDGWVYLKVMGIRGYSCFWWGITERGHNSWLSSQNMLPKMTTGTSLGNWRFFVNLDTTQTSSISWEHVNIVVRCSFPVSPARFVLKKERKSGTFHIEVRKDKSSKIATYFLSSISVWMSGPMNRLCWDMACFWMGGPKGESFGFWCSSISNAQSYPRLLHAPIFANPEVFSVTTRWMEAALSTRKSEVDCFFLVDFSFSLQTQVTNTPNVKSVNAIIYCNVKGLMILRLKE